MGDSKVLKQFLGDEEFPIDWASEEEKDLFWFFDDLHCPQPLSPMYFDIGGWWLTCDHMFRRFGTPFAADWIAKNINGYLYTAAIPAKAGSKVEAVEIGSRYAPRTPVDDPGYHEKIGAYLDGVLPTYGAHPGSRSGGWEPRTTCSGRRCCSAPRRLRSSPARF